MKMVRTIGVVGAGQMGRGIAQVAASSGYHVILQDVHQQQCDTALNEICAALERRVAAGKADQEMVARVLSNIGTAVQSSDLAICDLVIEAATETLTVKQEIFSQLDQFCDTDCILATNTSSISISEIVERVKHPERCVGMHFFFPVAAMKLVEIIWGACTSDETVASIQQVVRTIGKTPVECRKDTPGFIVNRCLFAFLLEAVHCYEDGIATIEDIDTAIKLGLNHPMGPFEMMDFSGLDTLSHACGSMQKLPITDWTTPESIKALLAAGRCGRKTKAGWYSYE